MSAYYHNIVTEKSFKILQKLRRTCDFILIGGWAVFVWTHSLKSKDIDIVLDYPELEKCKNLYALSKNDRLQKYEAKDGEVDIDIYAYHYSHPGLPAEDIANYAASKDGFLVPKPEVLLILKQVAHQNRQGTPKGEKDKIDILSLLALRDIDIARYRDVLAHYGLTALAGELADMLRSTPQALACNLNRHAMSRLRSRILAQLGL